MVRYYVLVRLTGSLRPALGPYTSVEQAKRGAAAAHVQADAIVTRGAVHDMWPDVYGHDDCGERLLRSAIRWSALVRKDQRLSAA